MLPGTRRATALLTLPATSSLLRGFREAGQFGLVPDAATWEGDSTVPHAAPPREVTRGYPRVEVN